ncbi:MULTISPECIES: phosphoserine phosphatase SerB [Pseudoalteromonas]|uniref:Phosphoserine phosphatase n=1 Tax=Pseudoalteromonas haloplanktis TaxID=228 RepID=A0ABU1B9F4_PSEHA|nr:MULTISPECIES: phosphoserine phosphatase SerB [Pseudoalteromonas]MCF6143862.1 phosphoserine phosphatase [Pseudoalteromonas mariniglutinosa NCIMB 1770]MDQ9090985.1 phosphoserine phosphatase SerB [Pseudoalteromonas haloplanktis]TMN65088.1 phosphoserine phosphatase SerB [Pseudoalteromonas sp. S1727]
MTLERIASLSSEQLSMQLSLGKWYHYQSALVEQAPLPADPQGVFSIAFTGNFNGQQLTDIVQFLSQQQFTVSAVCRYQPDPSLTPALCFYSDTANASINPLLLNEFAHPLGFQLVQVSKPPKLTAPGLLVMDMDSTAITIECIDEIARLADVYDDVAAVTAQAMAGKLDFSESLHQRVAKLEGIEQSLIDELKSSLPLMPGIKELCEVLKQHSWYLAIASGGFVPFAEQVQQLIGLDEIHANVLEFKDDRLTGKVLGTIVDAQQKAVVLRNLQQQLSLPMQQTVAIGDGANDLTMMAEAGLGVAVHGKPKVVEQAQAAICQGSLLQLLYLLTIPMAE